MHGINTAIKEENKRLLNINATNQNVLREDVRNKYRNLPEKEKNKKNEVSKRKIPHEYGLK